MRDGHVTLFLCGDVMTGRGIDQVLPHPGDPRLYEPYMGSAVGYVGLAEAANGPIPRSVDFAYVWGDALAELRRAAPDVRIVNLETAVTTSGSYCRGKGIHYRMHPRNLPCLTAAGIDCCVLANNHVLDWGYAGLAETLASLQAAGVRTAGAGADGEHAAAPAVMELAGGGRVLVYACGLESSGIPRAWGATGGRPGVHLLQDLSDASARALGERIHCAKRPGDLVVASLHWGANWGREVPREHIVFAHRLVDAAGVDVVHGHSSHHAVAIEVYRGRPILYGCGDFIDDYEGIGGYEGFRPDLVLMYFVVMDVAARRLVALYMVPMQLKRFRLQRAAPADARWIGALLDEEGLRFGTRVAVDADDRLRVEWR